MPLKIYDDSIGVLRRALAASRVGHSEKLHGMKRLDTLTRAVEDGRDPFADVNETIAHERSISRELGGRTVFDPPSRSGLRRDRFLPRQRPKPGQRALFSK